MEAPSPSAFPALVFLPPAGGTPAEQWMSAARRACAADLLDRLRAQGFSPLLLASGDPEAADALSAPDVENIAESIVPFHFGRALARIVESHQLTGLAYFGGASCPLATGEVVAGWRDQARRMVPDGALVNNLHSTDWAILRDARCVVTLADRLPTDNPLGWVLSREAGFEVEMPPPTTAARTDIDTPGDLALLRGHPNIGPRLRQALSPFPEDLERRADGLARVLHSPAASLALIGRVSESAWREIVRRSEVWVRVFAEERGMRASGRLARGEVSSLLAEMVEARGPAGFVARLGQLVQGALWDTRVWMAHRGAWPAAADRMAADLGWADEVAEEGLRALTTAIRNSGLPIVTGGQGVVAGGLRAFLEWTLPGRQPTGGRVT